VVAKAAKVKVRKEEAIVKVEAPEVEVVIKQETVGAVVGEVKAEEVEESMPDIEDIGKASSRRTPRKKT
jgi:endonuclease-3